MSRVGPFIESLYEDRFVLFLDILGFSHAILRARDNESDSRALVSVVRELVAENTITQESDTEGWNEIVGYWGARYLAVSDSILVSRRAQYANHAEYLHDAFMGPRFDRDINSSIRLLPFFHHLIPFSSIVRNAASLQVKLLLNGFLSRGGISRGYIHHHRGVIAGPALVDAVHLEKSCNPAPVVIVQREIAHRYCDDLDQVNERKAAYQRARGTLEVVAFDSWLESEEALQWFESVETIRNALVPCGVGTLVGIDFVTIADADRLWTDTERENAAKIVDAQIQELKKDAAANERAIGKWTWLKDRLSRRNC